MPRLCLLLGLLALCVPAPAHAGHGPAQLLFRFEDPDIVESSGVTASRTDGVLFTHNDSGDGPRFFAVGPDGETIATYTVAGAGSNDWEDMARGPGRDGTPSLFFGDIGTNTIGGLPSKASIAVYEIPEPEVTPGEHTVEPTAYYPLTYEDGAHDAETLMVAPDGRIIVVTKDTHATGETANLLHATGRNGVYVAEPPPAPGLLGVLRRVATIRFDLLGTPFVHPVYPANRATTTGGDISPDGSRVTIRTYLEAFEWSIPDGDLAAAFAGAAERIPLPATQQGEAIGYAWDGASLLTTSEGTRAPVHLVPADTRPPTDITAGSPTMDGLAATVTSSGTPLAGVPVTFRAGTYELCRTVTDADGRASCSEVVALAHAARAGGYSVSFDGDASHASAVAVTAAPAEPNASSTDPSSPPGRPVPLRP